MASYAFSLNSYCVYEINMGGFSNMDDFLIAKGRKRTNDNSV